MTDIHDVLIIGGGPAGYTAALYAARANLNPLVIEGFQWGGQLMITSDVENYPGFPNGILGPELMELWRKQAERFHAEFVDDNATKVDLKHNPLKVWVNDDLYETRTVVVATGADAKWLGLPSEERLKGKGVSACAVCDGFFFKGLDVASVGGGDTAMEDSLYLAKLCKSVMLIHRRNAFRASKIMQDRVFKTPNIKVVWDHIVEEVLGEKKVDGVRIKNVKTGKTQDLKVQGLFIAIGHTPATELFRGQLDVDANGYVVPRSTEEFRTATNLPPVFVAGDVHDHRYRQAVTAAGYGCMAALDAERWLQKSQS